MEDDLPFGRAIASTGWLALGAGLVLALLTEWLPFLRVLVGYFVVLVHELGHTLAGWLFGYPSIPAFDFTYGGGVTTQQEQQPLLVGIVYAGLAVLLYVFRANRMTLGALVVLALGYTAALVTSGANVAMLAMGHGAELMFAALFIHRAATGSACHHPAERPLYAWIGFHIVVHDLRFAWRLLTSPLEREMYADAKGGGHWMDFSQLAGEHLHVSIEAVAAVFFALCVLTPVVGLAASWLRPEISAMRERLGET